MDPRLRVPAVLVVALVLGAVLTDRVGANEPLLTIELTSNGPALFPVSTIESITFELETLVVAEVGRQPSIYTLESITRIWFDLSGVATSTPTGPETAATMVKALHLFQNRPNPTALSTLIQFDLPSQGRATLAIYDVTGTRVRTLVDRRFASGEHTVTWDGRNDDGQRVSAGVYFYHLRADGVDESRRMVYLR